MKNTGPSKKFKLNPIFKYLSAFSLFGLIALTVFVVTQKKYDVHLRAGAVLPNGAPAAHASINIDGHDVSEISKTRFVDQTVRLTAGYHLVTVKMWDNKGRYDERHYALNVGSQAAADLAVQAKL